MRIALLAALVLVAGVFAIWPREEASAPAQAPPGARFDQWKRLAAWPDKTEVPCPPQTARTAVVLGVGQSNIANFAERRIASTSNGRVVSYFDGRCTIAASPLLGAGFFAGEPLTRLGDLLFETGRYDAVVLVAASKGGERIAQFARGDLWPMLEATVASLRGRYRPTDIVWHQGESDFAIRASAEEYRQDFGRIERLFHDFAPDAAIYVSVATKCLPMERGWRADNAIAQAQRSLVDPARRIFEGVDTDALLASEDRIEECHMAASGQEKFAAAYAARIAGRP